MKNFKKVLAFALCIVMVCAMMVPAYAATTNQSISLSYDGALQYKNGYSTGSRVTIPLYVEGERQAAKIVITSGDYHKEITDFTESVKDTVSAKTSYTVSTSYDAENVRTISLAITGLYADLDIAVTTKETSYTIRANSGTYGVNNNYGSTGDATAKVNEAEQNVVGGGKYSVVFTPDAGLEITHLNIRANWSNKANVVAVSTTNTTVAGQVFAISKNKDGSVTVSCDAAKRDMFITALTDKAPAKYTLTVDADAYVSADVSSVVLPVNTVKDVVFTPASGYYVDKVKITDGKDAGVVSSSNPSAYINGHTYKLVYDVRGIATLTVPSIAADVKVEAVTETGHTYVVVRGKGIDSNYENLTYVKDTSSVTVVISPKPGTVINDIRVETANGTDIFNAEDGYFVIAGTVYRVSHNNDDILIYLNPVPGNTEITVNANSYNNVVTAITDNGATVVGSSRQDVDNGDDCSVTFRPVNNYEIKEIVVTVAGKKYSASVNRGYVNVNGVRYPVDVTSTGRVTVNLKDVQDDTSVKAVTNYTGKYNSDNLVTKNSSSRVTITVNPSYVEYGDSATITVRPAKGYTLDNILVESGGRTVTVNRNTRSFTVNGQSFSVRTNSDDAIVLYCSNLTKAVNVSAKTTLDKDYVDETFHEAYMFGVGGNRFAPENEISRGEAVALLSRLFSGLTDKELANYDTDSQYRDVRSGAWYTPYIVWAEDAGVLDDLYGYTRSFAPEQMITRAEFVDLVCRFQDGYDEYGYNLRYNDMTWAHWASRQIAYATGMGWVNGYTSGAFGPDDTLTRCQVAAIVNRVTDRDSTNVIIPNGFRLVTFSDVPETHWAYTAIVEASNDHYVVRTTAAGEVWE